jgi:hypothetical protein
MARIDRLDRPASNAPLKLDDAVRWALGFTRHKSTIYRWCKRGVTAANGLKCRLAYRRIGGELFTTIDDVLEFDRQLNERLTPEFVPQSILKPPSEAHRRRNAARLKALGV